MADLKPRMARAAVKYLKDEKFQSFPFLPGELATALLPYIFIPRPENKAPQKSIDAFKTEAMFKAAMAQGNVPSLGSPMLRDYVWTHVSLEALIEFERIIRADCAAKGEKK